MSENENEENSKFVNNGSIIKFDKLERLLENKRKLIEYPNVIFVIVSP